jgi:ADP-dependent phosphofructokinase/glucokinase
MITIRKFQQQDFEMLLELANRAVPFAPEENKEWFEYRKAFDESTRLRYHYIAEEFGQSVGYGCLEQQGEDPKEFRIFIVCDPKDLRREVGNALYDRLREKAQELSATQLWARELQEDDPINEFSVRGVLRKRRGSQYPM